MWIEQLSVSLSLSAYLLPTPEKRMTFRLSHPSQGKKYPGVANGVTKLLDAALYYY